MLGREMIFARNTTLSSLLFLQKISALSENRINYPLFNSLIHSPPEPGVVTSEGQSYRCTHRDAPIACESTSTQCNSCFCLCEAAATGMFGCAFFGRTMSKKSLSERFVVDSSRETCRSSRGRIRAARSAIDPTCATMLGSI